MRRPSSHHLPHHRPREFDNAPMEHGEGSQGLHRFARGGARRGNMKGRTRFIAGCRVLDEAADMDDRFAYGGRRKRKLQHAGLKAHGGRSKPRADKRARGGGHVEIQHADIYETHGGKHQWLDQDHGKQHGSRGGRADKRARGGSVPL